MEFRTWIESKTNYESLDFIEEEVVDHPDIVETVENEEVLEESCDVLGPEPIYYIPADEYVIPSVTELDSSRKKINFEDVYLSFPPIVQQRVPEPAVEVELDINTENLPIGQVFTEELSDEILPPQEVNLLSETGTISIGFQCNQCNKFFAHAWDLKRHEKIVHNKLDDLKCLKCGKSFKLLHSLQKHVKTVHQKEKFYHCHYCYKTFAESGNLQVHIKTIHQGLKQFKCEECGKCFSQSGNLTSHIRAVHRKIKEFTCHLCGYDFGGVRSLEAHLKAAHANSNYSKCSTCELQFTSFRNLQEHIEKEHIKYRSYTCPTCGIDFGYDVVLQSHLKQSHQVVDTFVKLKYKCDICSARFSSKPFYQMHMIKEHSIGGKQATTGDKDKLTYIPSKSYICPLCNKLYEESQQLNDHLLICQKINDISLRFPRQAIGNLDVLAENQCEQCGLKFDSIQDLNCHLSICPKMKQCLGCDKVFDDSESREDHLIKCSNVNINIKKADAVLENLQQSQLPVKNQMVVCKQCGQKCYGKYGLSKHSSHCLGCSLCNLVFTNSEALEQHKLASHSSTVDQTNQGTVLALVNGKLVQMNLSQLTLPVNEANQCKQCGMLFREIGDLNKHLLICSKFECSSCHSIFQDQNSLLNHLPVCPCTEMQEITTSTEIDFQPNEELIIDESLADFCEKCGQKYSIEEDLLKHSVSCLVCDVCKLPFSSLMELDLHKKECLPPNTPLMSIVADSSLNFDINFVNNKLSDIPHVTSSVKTTSINTTSVETPSKGHSSDRNTEEKEIEKEQPYVTNRLLKTYGSKKMQINSEEMLDFSSIAIHSSINSTETILEPKSLSRVSDHHEISYVVGSSPKKNIRTYEKKSKTNFIKDLSSRVDKVSNIKRELKDAEEMPKLYSSLLYGVSEQLSFSHDVGVSSIKIEEGNNDISEKVDDEIQKTVEFLIHKTESFCETFHLKRNNRQENKLRTDFVSRDDKYLNEPKLHSTSVNEKKKENPIGNKSKECRSNDEMMKQTPRVTSENSFGKTKELTASKSFVVNDDNFSSTSTKSEEYGLKTLAEATLIAAKQNTSEKFPNEMELKKKILPCDVDLDVKLRQESLKRKNADDNVQTSKRPKINSSPTNLKWTTTMKRLLSSAKEFCDQSFNEATERRQSENPECFSIDNLI